MNHIDLRLGNFIYFFQSFCLYQEKHFFETLNFWFMRLDVNDMRILLLKELILCHWINVSKFMWPTTMHLLLHCWFLEELKKTLNSIEIPVAIYTLTKRCLLFSSVCVHMSLTSWILWGLLHPKALKVCFYLQFVWSNTSTCICFLALWKLDESSTVQLQVLKELPAHIKSRLNLDCVWWWSSWTRLFVRVSS